MKNLSQEVLKIDYPVKDNMTQKFLNYNLSTRLPALNSQTKLLINTINPHSYCAAEKDPLFRSALTSSDVLLPDGVGIIWGCRLLYKKSIDKISGFDLHLNYLNELNRKGGRVFYLGSKIETLTKIEERIKREFPNITVASFSPPFKPEFSNEENEEILNLVNEFKPDILFIGMTAPKQEKWAFEFKDKINSNAICAIGAVFDFFAGTVSRPSQWWIDNGLEWFPRLLHEPRRLWKRTFISTPLFIFYMVHYRLTMKGISKHI